jgi:hypothetical protein
MSAADEHAEPSRRGAEIDKEGASADPTLPQPSAAEVESARLLANEARETLRARGLSDTDIDRLAGAFIAREVGTAVEGFVSWAVSAGHEI